MNRTVEHLQETIHEARAHGVPFEVLISDHDYVELRKFEPNVLDPITDRDELMLGKRASAYGVDMVVLRKYKPGQLSVLDERGQYLYHAALEEGGIGHGAPGSPGTCDACLVQSVMAD